MGKAKKKQRTPLSNSELSAKISRLISIRPVANEYRELCGDIKDELQHRKLDGFETATGEKATLTSKPGHEWLVPALAKVLDEPIFESLCPRKPDARRLNQRLAALPDDKKLAACRVEVPGKKELEVLAPGATAEPVIELEEAA